MSDSLAYAMGWADTLADSFSLPETTALAFSRDLTETPTLSEALAKSFSTSFADSTTISESILVELIIGTGAKLNQSGFNIFALNS